MLTSQKLETIRKDMELALSMVESTHNLQFKIGRMTYSRSTFSCKIEAGMSIDGGEANIEKNLWDKDCYMFGLHKDDFGKRFKTIQGDVYTIEGIRSRKTKYPIVGKDMIGNSYKFRAPAVVTGLLLMSN